MRTPLLLSLYLAGSLLAWSQSPPEKPSPRPGEAQTNSTQSDKVKNQRNAPTTNASPPTDLGPTDAPYLKGTSTNPTSEDKQQATTNIGSIPRLFVEPVKDWTDRAYWVFSALLVVVGGLQVSLLYRSWRAAQTTAQETHRYAVAAEETQKATERNATAAKANADAAKATADAALRQISLMEESLRATKDAADAATKSAEMARINTAAIVNSERAWVVASPASKPIFFGPGPEPRFFRFHLKNCGRTIARLMGPFQHFFRLIDAGEELPPDPSFENPEIFWGGNVGPEHGRLLIPGESSDIGFPCWGISLEDFVKIRNRSKRLFFYASLKYFDFVEKNRELRFCYEYAPKTEGTAEGWVLSGPPEYNKHIAPPGPKTRSTQI